MTGVQTCALPISMHTHATTWEIIMRNHGISFSKNDAYMNEGRTGIDIVDVVCKRENRNISENEKRDIYKEKTEAFAKSSTTKRMCGSYELLLKIKQYGLIPMIVTGSGTPALLDNLNKNFPDIFKRELMITAMDVKLGKPNPEPYIKALQKAKLNPWNAVVVENAPLGIKASHDAGIFTIAVNTGPLDDEILFDAGANILYSSMPALNSCWDNDFACYLSHNAL